MEVFFGQTDRWKDNDVHGGILLLKTRGKNAKLYLFLQTAQYGKDQLPSYKLIA